MNILFMMTFSFYVTKKNNLFFYLSGNLAFIPASWYSLFYYCSRSCIVFCKLFRKDVVSRKQYHWTQSTIYRHYARVVHIEMSVHVSATFLAILKQFHFIPIYLTVGNIQECWRPASESCLSEINYPLFIWSGISRLLWSWSIILNAFSNVELQI
jgi:hypothetical protein